MLDADLFFDTLRCCLRHCLRMPPLIYLRRFHLLRDAMLMRAMPSAADMLRQR